MQLKQVLAGTIAATALSWNASAMMITPGGYLGMDSTPLTTEQIGGILNVSGLVQLYHQPLEGLEAGAYADSYSTVFSETPTSPQNADIGFDGGASISGFSGLWLYVKDGNFEPAFYLIDISQWNGTETLSLRQFWGGDGEITQVTILGSRTSAVPDGGTTALLLGAGLTVLGTVRRFLRF